MPKKVSRRRGGSRKVRKMPMNGAGFFGDVWSGLKSAGKWAFNNVVDPALKETKILSTAASRIPYLGGPISGAIASRGYGRRGGMRPHAAVVARL